MNANTPPSSPVWCHRLAPFATLILCTFDVLIKSLPGLLDQHLHKLHLPGGSQIEGWLAENDTSPITGLPLSSKALFPNRYLREEIERYKIRQILNPTP